MSTFLSSKGLLRRAFVIFLTFILIFSFASCKSNNSNQNIGQPVPGLEDYSITLSTTTSVNDSGLLEYLIPMLKEDTGIEVNVLSQGTGQAIQTAVDGNADVILVHSKAAEEEFVKDGYGVERIELMYNYFIVIGPEGDPAGMESSGLSASKALKKLYEEEMIFVSRGDDSGTHKKELSLWKLEGIEPSGEWYISAGRGMGDVLIMASEMEGYALSDKATFLTMKEQLDLEILIEESEDLKNQYTLIEVSPKTHPDTNTQAVKAFIDWVTSEKTLRVIDEYGVSEYGEALFISNYHK
ncbi:substrate-binding domain-containing protein [Alkalibacter saccharofermentans]|uniref:Tungstate transport system substrate-binding protein n=1 Tax=Alkalibacter saccharofermentans DSM 14828 TaxID=1120975 RepID=A0A1M4TN98_9FIRM|nr:substrate-binding domain-containing protein [Alkalibacter saccharofermentans]SHE45943.1 tungstate transport system substrate-binding protein [Alkalibacter saccharofermentans DSM 14828]